MSLGFLANISGGVGYSAAWWAANWVYHWSMWSFFLVILTCACCIYITLPVFILWYWKVYSSSLAWSVCLFNCFLILPVVIGTYSPGDSVGGGAAERQTWPNGHVCLCAYVSILAGLNLRLIYLLHLSVKLDWMMSVCFLLSYRHAAEATDHSSNSWLQLATLSY